MHLTAEEFGAYCLLLFATWRNNGQPLPDEDRRLSRICRVTEKRWRTILRPRLVEFFDVSDGFWHQKRLEKEWNRVAYLSGIRRSIGSRGGISNSLKNKETHVAIANDLPQANGPANDELNSSTQTHIQDIPPNGGSPNPPSRRDVAEEMLEVWKTELGGVLSVPSKLTTDRITLANSRFRQEFHENLDEWRAYCQAIRSKPFLIGDNNRHWRADFDWALKQKSALGVLEGKYDSCSRHNQPIFGEGIV